jgi:prephenate dehydrogenase
MMLGVLQSNRENVLHALRQLQSQLSEIESALSADDFSKIEALLKEAQKKHQSFNP